MTLHLCLRKNSSQRPAAGNGSGAGHSPTKGNVTLAFGCSPRGKCLLYLALNTPAINASLSWPCNPLLIHGFCTLITSLVSQLLHLDQIKHLLFFAFTQKFPKEKVMSSSQFTFLTSHSVRLGTSRWLASQAILGSGISHLRSRCDQGWLIRYSLMILRSWHFPLSGLRDGRHSAKRRL